MPARGRVRARAKGRRRRPGGGAGPGPARLLSGSGVSGWWETRSALSGCAAAGAGSTAAWQRSGVGVALLYAVSAAAGAAVSWRRRGGVLPRGTCPRGAGGGGMPVTLRSPLFFYACSLARRVGLRLAFFSACGRGRRVLAACMRGGWSWVWVRAPGPRLCPLYALCGHALLSALPCFVSAAGSLPLLGWCFGRLHSGGTVLRLRVVCGSPP